MDKDYYVRIGDLMIRNTDQNLSFDPGDEFDPLVWICSGRSEVRIPEYDEEGMTIGMSSLPDFIPLDIFTGKKCEYGLHMFMTYEEFMNDYRRIRFFMKRDPNYLKKLTYDLNHEHLYTATDLRRIQIINAVIHQVRLFFDGIESGEILIPGKVISIMRECTDKLLHNIAELEKFEIPTPSELEQIKKNQKNDDVFKEAEEAARLQNEQEREENLQAQFEYAMESYDSGTIDYDENIEE